MKITQRLGLFGGQITITVGNDDVLVLSLKKLTSHSENKYLLDHIDSRFSVFKDFSMGAAITAVLTLLASIALVIAGQMYFTPPDDFGPYLFAFIFFGVFLVAFRKAVNSRVNIISFNGHDGRHLFSIFGNKPSIPEVTDFCEKLAKLIDGIRYSGEISSERMADILCKHVEYLYKNNVLSEEERIRAIKRINEKTKLSVVPMTVNRIQPDSQGA